MLRDMILAVPHANLYAVALSIFGLIFLKIGKDFVNPIVKRHSPVPVPFELLLVSITLLTALITRSS